MPRPLSKPPSGCPVHTEILPDIQANTCFKSMRLLRASVKAYAKRCNLPIKAVQSNSIRYEAACVHPKEDGCTWRIKGKAVAGGIAWITKIVGRCKIHNDALPTLLATVPLHTHSNSTVANGGNASAGGSIQVSQVIEQCVREHHFINPKADIDVLQKYVFRDTKIWPNAEDVSACVAKIQQENLEAERRRLFAVCPPPPAGCYTMLPSAPPVFHNPS